ncbi:TPA: hypothetical protein ACH3X1_013545 [Trebouxia sp. C0004]
MRCRKSRRKRQPGNLKPSASWAQASERSSDSIASYSGGPSWHSLNMTTPNALVSMIMAMNPTFRTRNDRVAFAVHAFMVANGFKLEAVGDNADKASSAESIRSSERVAEFDTWNASADAYTFLYNPDPWQQGVIEKPMLLKIVSLGDQLLLNWVTLHSAQHEPQQLELEASHYITSKSGLPACYQNIDDLVGKLRSTTHPAEQSAGLKPREAASAKGQLNNAASMRQEAEPDYGAADDEFPKGTCTEHTWSLRLLTKK